MLWIWRQYTVLDTDQTYGSTAKINRWLFMVNTKNMDSNNIWKR